MLCTDLMIFALESLYLMPTLPFAAPEFVPLRLRKNEARQLRAGHLRVYSNEMDTTVTPMRNFTPGRPVTIQSSHGKTIGTGHVNPHTLLCARLVSHNSGYPFTKIVP